MLEGARENSCHTTGEKKHGNNDPKIQKTQDFHTASCVNTEEQEHLDLPLVVVHFPESRKNHLDYRLRESTVQNKTQNVIKPEHRLSTALQKADSAGRDKGFSLIMGHRWNIEQKDNNCSSDDVARGVSRSSSRRATNDHGSSSSFCSNMESMDTLKLPPGSILVNDQGVFHTKYKKRPFACGYCGKNYTRKKDVYRHIMQKHDEKHVTSHTHEKPFTCDQCGMRFRLESDLCHHKFMHTEERLFPCNVCNKSYMSNVDLCSHRKVHEEEECTESIICNICKKEFSDQYMLKEHMRIHADEKPFKCSLCDRNFRVKIHLQQHTITHNKNDPDESQINVPVQLVTSPGKGEFIQCNSKAGEMTTQDPILSSNYSTVLVERLPDITGLVENNIQPFQLEDSQIQTQPILSTAPSGLPTTDADSALICTNSRLLSALQGSSENVCNEDVSESEVPMVGEPRTSNTLKTKSNQTQGKGYPTKATNGKRISVSSVVVYEDEVSSPEGSQCSTTTQTLLSSEDSEVAKEVPDHAVDDRNSALSDEAELLLSSELPPGSMLLDHHGVFRTKDKEKPFTCGYCGKTYDGYQAVCSHIALQHEEKRYSCEFCGRRFGHQCHLAVHVVVHTQEKPFSCDQCGLRLRYQGELRRHTLTHTKDRPFSCRICHKSFMSESNLLKHSKIHKKAEGRESFICNICKKEFSRRSHLKQHMATHTADKNFKCLLCDRHFRAEWHLQQHMITHTQNGKLLLEDSPDQVESKINVLVQSATSRGKGEFIQWNSKAGEMTAQEPILSSNNSSAFVEQLPDIVESSSHLFQVKDRHSQVEPSLATATRELATADSRSRLTRSNRGLMSALKNSSDKLYNEAVSESRVRESWISNSVETKSNKSRDKCSSKSVNGKRISSARGIIYEDEVSSPESSQCSTTTQTLLSEVDKEHPASSSRQSANDDGKSPSFRSHVESMVSSKPPPGATLLYFRRVFYTKGKEKPFTCGFCGKAYRLKHSAYGHIIHSHEEKRYSCEFCGKRYSKQSFLAQHVTIHTQEKPFTCDQCGMRFRFETVLRRHKYTHSEERLFPCNKCSKSFKTTEVLSRHSEIHKKVEEREGVICNICKKTLRKSSSLKQHMMIHTGEKPFKCSLCDRKFRMNVELGYHMNTHSGKKRLVDKSCSVCGKTVGASYISTHMRMHTGEKRFECNICGKRFPKKQNLDGHIRSHTGEKPFACSRCDKRFALYSNMVTHKTKCKALSENLA